MNLIENPFLRKLQQAKEVEEEDEEEKWASNPFLSKIERPKAKEEQLAEKAQQFSKGVESAGKGLTSVAKQIPRNLMQGAIGAAKGALYTSPAGVPAIVADIATPGAIDEALLEQIHSERDMPASIKKAIGFKTGPGESDIDFNIARQTAKNLYNKVTGGKGIVGAAVSSPFTAAGIETEPQTATEQATLNAAEILTGAGIKNPRQFAELVFDQLPSAVKNVFKSKMNALEKMLIGEEPLPKSVYESAEKALQELQKRETAAITNRKPPDIPPPGGSAPSLEGRVKPSGEDIGLRPIPTTPPKNVQEEVGRIFSPTTFKNTTEGGKAIKDTVTKLDEAAYRNVNKLYQRSRELNSTVEDIHPNLVHTMLDRLQGLQKIPEPSGPQKQLITALENIIGELAEIQEGRIVGYKPANNQILIDQIQSLRQKVDYDFAHGDARNIFKPTINDIQNSVRSAAEHSANPEALESFDIARNGYKDWVNTFDNDYIRPIRNVQNRDYSKTFKGAQDVDEFNELKKILEKSPEGKQISDTLQREIVAKYTDKYADKPIKESLKSLDKDLRELEAIATPEQIAEVRNKLLEAHKPAQKTFKATPIQREAAKYLDVSKPETISNMFNTRSGIKEIRKDLSKTEKGKKLYETLKRQKVRDILRESQIEKEFTGNDLYKTLNKRDNFELMAEMIGEEETEAARLAAKELGKKQMTSENAKKLGKHVLSLKFLKFVYPLL